MVCYYKWIAYIRSERIHTSSKHSLKQCWVFKVRPNHPLVSCLCQHCQPKNDWNLVPSQLQILPRHHRGPFLGIMRAITLWGTRVSEAYSRWLDGPGDWYFLCWGLSPQLVTNFNPIVYRWWKIADLLQFSLVDRYPSISQINNPRPEPQREICWDTKPLRNTKSANWLPQGGLCLQI